MIVSSTTSAADIALLDRIARRDQGGLAELYDRHCRLLFSLILRILRDRGEAEDVLQEVFVRVWDRADSYNPSLGTPAAWLVRISRNRAIDRLRSRTVRAGIQAPEIDRPEQAADPAPDADPERFAASTEERRVIAEAVAALPPEQRRVDRMRVLRGLHAVRAGRALRPPARHRQNADSYRHAVAPACAGTSGWRDAMSRIDGSTLAALDALGLLDDADRVELERALSGSEDLRGELHDLREVAALLAATSAARGAIGGRPRPDCRARDRRRARARKTAAVTSAALHRSRRRLAAASDTGHHGQSARRGRQHRRGNAPGQGCSRDDVSGAPSLRARKAAT